MAYVLGIDISSYDIASDWTAVYNQGVRFVIVKASENAADGLFSQHWPNAKKAGMYRGAYHFFHPEKGTAAQQADLFIQTVGADKGELPPVLDLEPVLDNKGNDLSPSGSSLLSQMKIWLDAVEAAFGRKPMIYTSNSYVTSHAVNAPWLVNYPLWIAQYPWMPGTQAEYSDLSNAPTPGGIPQQPAGFQPWTFWQYSEAGTVNGFSSKLDLDYFKGSLTDLATFAGNIVGQPSSGGQQQTLTQQYVMQSGDTLQAIATKFNMSLSDLVNLNNAILVQPGRPLTVHKQA